jgi:hypothetical protein
MGCSSTNVDKEDFTPLESLLNEKKKILSESKDINEVSEEKKTKMVRLDIDITEKLEDLNSKIKEDNRPEIKNKYEEVKNEFQSLVTQWKQFLREDVEEEDIIQGKIAKDWGTTGNKYEYDDEINNNNNYYNNNDTNKQEQQTNNMNNRNNDNNKKEEYPYLNNDENSF